MKRTTSTVYSQQLHYCLVHQSRQPPLSKVFGLHNNVIIVLWQLCTCQNIWGWEIIHKTMTWVCLNIEDFDNNNFWHNSDSKNHRNRKGFWVKGRRFWQTKLFKSLTGTLQFWSVSMLWQKQIGIFFLMLNKYVKACWFSTFKSYTGNQLWSCDSKLFCGAYMIEEMTLY